MNSLAAPLLATSASIILLLGVAHMALTFVGNRLHPRDGELEARMRADFPVLTRKTTMWKAWVGFNASHSGGAMLFGVLYGYLALAHEALLFGSGVLLGVGGAFLAFYVALGWRYWFSAPRRGILLASALYLLALIARWA